MKEGNIGWGSLESGSRSLIRRPWRFVRDTVPIAPRMRALQVDSHWLASVPPTKPGEDRRSSSGESHLSATKAGNHRLTRIRRSQQKAGCRIRPARLPDDYDHRDHGRALRVCLLPPDWRHPAGLPRFGLVKSNGHGHAAAGGLLLGVKQTLSCIFPCPATRIGKKGHLDLRDGQSRASNARAFTTIAPFL